MALKWHMVRVRESTAKKLREITRRKEAKYARTGDKKDDCSSRGGVPPSMSDIIEYLANRWLAKQGRSKKAQEKAKADKATSKASKSGKAKADDSVSPKPRKRS